MSRRAPLIVGIVAAAVALLVVVVLLLPRNSAVSQAREDLAAAEQQEQDLRAQLASLKDARRQARQVERELAHLQTKIPPTPDLPSMIRLLQGASDQSAVDFMSVQPGTPTAGTTGGISTIPTQITVAGSFFSVEEFLFKLETLPRAMKVTQITVTPSAGTTTGTTTAATQAPGTLQLVITAEAYTTDTSAGPGSVPGTQEAAPGTGGTPAPATT